MQNSVNVIKNVLWRSFTSNLLYLIFGPLLVLPMYLIGRQLYGPRVGLVTAALAAFWPAFNVAVPWWGTMTEPPFYFFVAVGLWAGLRVANPKDSDTSKTRPSELRAWGLAGLAFGLAYLTRPEGIWYVPMVGGAMLLAAVLQRLPWHRWLLGGLTFALGFSLCFVPYAIHTRINTGGWMVSEKVGITFQDSLALARNDMAEHDRILWQLDSTGEQVFFFSPESFHLSMWDSIQANPRRYAGVIYLNVQSLLRQFFTVQDFLPAFLPLLGLGLFGATWNRRRARGELLMVAAALPPLSFLLFFIFPRYLSPLLLPMLPWTALGLIHLGEWCRNTVVTLNPRTGRRTASAAVWLPISLAIAILLGTHPWTLAAVYNPPAARLEHRSAGEWLAANAPAEAIVMARYPAIAFHADRHWIPSPNSALDPALRYARSQGASYWTVDSNEGKWRTLLAGLSAGQAPPGMELVHTETGSGVSVFVYRLP